MKGTDIVIATPGRLIAMLTSFQANFSKLKFLVLDEADRMLDMGFYDDIMRILRYVPAERQTLMFSATMPPKMRKLASGLMKKPVEVNLSISKPAEGVDQRFYSVLESDKLNLLQHLLSEQQYESIILFASTKQKVKALENTVKKINLHAQSFHSDLTQEQRDKAMLAFRNRQIPVIIGTDILSRGIDVEGIDLVVNFDVPPDPEDYIHRIGRTARADAKGTAITFVNPDDSRKFFRIEQLLGRTIELNTVPAVIGESPVITRNANRQGNSNNRKGKTRSFSRK
jgi:superfamily II DNA/RNA helicase